MESFVDLLKTVLGRNCVYLFFGLKFALQEWQARAGCIHHEAQGWI